MRNASLLVHNKTHKETIYQAFTNKIYYIIDVYLPCTFYRIVITTKDENEFNFHKH